MFQKLLTYIKDVRQEMTKVSWPSRAEMMESARLVLVLSLVLGVVVFFVDRILSYGLEQLL
ncbi:preprotein translocase subunit SecE [candidate division KSB1 bacterium]|nr:preprotein translocase subunit SecE [candidate division KSB1 bacterium]